VTVGYRFARAGLEIEVDGVPMPDVAVHRVTEKSVDIETDGVRRSYRVHRRGRDSWVDGPEGCSHLVEHRRFPTGPVEDVPGSLHAPMPGRVVKVLVSEGDSVEAGQALLVLEAMKMEHTLRAPHAGKVSAVKAQPEDQVEADHVLVVVE
jgi:biotin carboxyl carrier protein